MSKLIVKDRVCSKCDKMYAGNFPTCYTCKETRKCKVCPRIVSSLYVYCFDCNPSKKKRQEPYCVVQIPKRDVINGFLNKKFSPLCYCCLKYTTESYSYISGQYSHREYRSKDDLDFVYLHEQCWESQKDKDVLKILNEFNFTVLLYEAFDIIDNQN
jgi:hypothetical protein